MAKIGKVGGSAVDIARDLGGIALTGLAGNIAMGLPKLILGGIFGLYVSPKYIAKTEKGKIANYAFGLLTTAEGLTETLLNRRLI